MGGTGKAGSNAPVKSHWHAAAAAGPIADAPFSAWPLRDAPPATESEDVSGRLAALMQLAGFDGDLSTTTALMAAALADHDAIMAATFSFGQQCREATTDDWLALVADDVDPDDLADADPATAALAKHLDDCALCRWRARLAWQADVPAAERSPQDELERLIVEPAVTWRELELEWLEAGAVALAATATATQSATVVCLDGNTGRRIRPEQIAEPTWVANGDGRSGRITLSLFGIPSGFARYKLVLFAGHHLRRLLDSLSGNAADDLVLPPLDVIERHAPDLLQALLPERGLPPVALPWFAGRLTPYGDKCALNWSSPVVGPVRLRPDDVLLACMY